MTLPETDGMSDCCRSAIPGVPLQLVCQAALKQRLQIFNRGELHLSNLFLAMVQIIWLL